MKNLLLVLVSFFLIHAATAQKTASKVEVLYFKANLSCCQAKACNNLESTIKEIVEENFSSQEVIFKTVAIADEANASLVAKYNAKSQTVVMVNTKKNKSLDVSDIVRQYLRDGDKTVFSKSLVEKAKTTIKL
jgi:hypothetical protein